MHLKEFLPPWVVARIAGHSLDVHMAYYSSNDSYMPSEKGRDYGTFGVLTSAGTEVVAKYLRPGMVGEMLDKGKL